MQPLSQKSRFQTFVYWPMRLVLRIWATNTCPRNIGLGECSCVPSRNRLYTIPLSASLQLSSVYSKLPSWAVTSQSQSWFILSFNFKIFEIFLGLRNYHSKFQNYKLAYFTSIFIIFHYLFKLWFAKKITVYAREPLVTAISIGIFANKNIIL